MARPEGTPKTGGRKKGTPNRRSMELADQLADAGLDVPTELVKTLPELDAKTRASVLIELMNFLFPKRKAVEHTGLPGEASQLTKEEMAARVQEYNQRLSELETPGEKAERQARAKKHLDKLIMLRQMGR